MWTQRIKGWREKKKNHTTTQHWSPHQIQYKAWGMACESIYPHSWNRKSPNYNISMVSLRLTASSGCPLSLKNMVPSSRLLQCSLRSPFEWFATRSHGGSDCRKSLSQCHCLSAFYCGATAKSCPCKVLFCVEYLSALRLYQHVFPIPTPAPCQSRIPQLWLESLWRGLRTFTLRCNFLFS